VRYTSKVAIQYEHLAVDDSIAPLCAMHSRPRARGVSWRCDSSSIPRFGSTGTYALGLPDGIYLRVYEDYPSYLSHLWRQL
jgi:hypothetical protein